MPAAISTPMTIPMKMFRMSVSFLIRFSRTLSHKATPDRNESENRGLHRVHPYNPRNPRLNSEERIDMLFIAQFEDKPGVGELRQKLMAEHFAFLDSRKDKVLVAGSVREIPSDLPLGGLWIIEAENEAEVREIFKDDPFWVNGMRASVRINRWVKAFPDRKTPV